MKKHDFLEKLEELLDGLQRCDIDSSVEYWGEMIDDKIEEGLTEEELTERDKLRRIYIDSVKANLVGQLENTYIVSPDGTKRKVTHK